MHDLNEFNDPKNFKSYAELKARFEKVTGQSTMTTQATEDLSRTAPAPSFNDAPPAREFAPVTAEAMESSTAGEEDTLSYFSRLTAEE